jgi:hypothetical protein
MKITSKQVIYIPLLLGLWLFFYGVFGGNQQILGTGLGILCASLIVLIWYNQRYTPKMEKDGKKSKKEKK